MWRKNDMKTQLYVRFDDVSPTMDYSQFEKGIELMNKCGAKPLLGVIPCNKDLTQVFENEREDYWEMIRELQKKGFVIAMHGCEHVYDVDEAKNIVCFKKHSEFAGHDYSTQFEKIKKGKEELMRHGIVTNVFFAPGHTYDKNTLRALRDNGFSYVSDGLSKKPYKQCGIVCLPCRSFGVSRIRKRNINIAVIHANEWNDESKINEYKKFVELCENNKVSDFSDFLSSPLGLLYYQKLLEKLYKVWLFKLKPLARRLLRK